MTNTRWSLLLSRVYIIIHSIHTCIYIVYKITTSRYTIRPARNLRTSDAPRLTTIVTNHCGDVQTTYQTGRWLESLLRRSNGLQTILPDPQTIQHHARICTSRTERQPMAADLSNIWSKTSSSTVFLRGYQLRNRTDENDPKPTRPLCTYSMVRSRGSDEIHET